MRSLPFLAATLLAITGSLAGTSHAQAAAERSAPGTQTGFRLRSDFTAALNADHGWAAPLNATATVTADQPFRLRLELETPAGVNPGQAYGLQVRRNGGAWVAVEAHDFPHPDTEDAKTPRVSIVATPAYAHGAATTDLLASAASTFHPGAGVSLTDRTPVGSAAAGHSEFEWPLVVRRYADDAETNESGDEFEFRLVTLDGTSVETRTPARVRLTIPAGHVGGTFVETPGRIGPWQAANGDLYFIMEPTETSNLFLMMKSADGGKTWREVDGANRPPTRDLESVDSRQVGDTIHIVHQVTRSTRYHAFRTSDHPTHPDTWAIGGELAASATSVAQATTFAVRSDGSLVAFYVGQTKVHFAIRSPAGVWSAETVIDADVAPSLAGPQAVLGANDTVHLAYYGWDGTIWYRRLLRDGTLTPRMQLATGAGTTRAEYVAVLPLIHLPATDTVVILYRLANGKLWERRIVRNGPPTPAVQVTDRDVVRNAVDSQQPGADVVEDRATRQVLFIEPTSRSLFHTHDRGGWQPSVEQVGGIRGSWVRGNVFTRPDGVRVYGYVYDAGSDGGSGMNRYAEIVLSQP